MTNYSLPAALAAISIAVLFQGSVAFQTIISQQPLTPSSSRCNRPVHRTLLAESDGSTEKSEDDCCPPIAEDGPEILKPFLPAMDPKYKANGPLGEGDFIISRTGPPTAEEMSN